jgi:hypothetical protein
VDCVPLHDGLLYKIKHSLPSYFNLFKSYLNDRQFRTAVNGVVSKIFPIKSGVPQGSILGPLFYLLYTSDIPTTAETTIGTLADDTIILSSHEHPETASEQLQHHLNLLDQWVKKWKIKINESKSTQIMSALKRGQCPPVFINNAIIPESASVRYLGIQLDKNSTLKNI